MTRLKWILIGALLVAVPAIVAIFGVTLVQAVGVPDAIGAIDSPTVISHPGFDDDTIDMQALLADTLGISVEELEAAQQAAFEASVAAAVDEGKINQEQADQILEREGTFDRGFGFRGPGMRGYGGWGGSSYGDFLAAALGITVEALQEAHQTARDAALEQLVEEGVLTEEQAEALGERLPFGFGPGHGFGHRGIDGECHEGFGEEEGHGPHHHRFNWPGENQEETSNT